MKYNPSVIIFTAFLSIILLFADAGSIYADEETANSPQTDLIIHAGGGTGSSLFGVVNNSTDSSKLGDGNGKGFDAGIMGNYNIFFAALNSTYTTYDKMEWTETPGKIKTKYSSDGTGHYYTFNTILGLYLNKETGDMGHTDLYAGVKYWKALRDYDSITIDDIEQPDSSGKYEITGYGWIIGAEDFSTLPIGIISVIIDSGLWIYDAPATHFEKDGKNINFKEKQNNGFGFKIGTGFAFENIGLSVIGGLKAELTGTTFRYKDSSAGENILGAGYMQFFLTVKKHISF